MRMSHLLAAIAASSVATAACKKAPKPAEEESETRAMPTTSTSPSPAPTSWELGDLKTVTTTSPVQGIEVWAPELDSLGKQVEYAAMFEYGSHCLNNASECWKSWNDIRSAQEKAKVRVYAIVTRDVDAHEVVTDEKKLRALLGPIDTPGEAAILATFLGAARVFVPQCTGMSRTIVMDKTAEGYTMALEKRVRKAPTKDGGCTDCIIAESRKNVVVRHDGVVDLGTATEGEWARPMGCGRSPGWSDPKASRSRARNAGEYLAHAAHLEAASVAAFERMADELTALGAPAELVARARRGERRDRACSNPRRSRARARREADSVRFASVRAARRVRARARQCGRGLRERDLRRAGSSCPGAPRRRRDDESCVREHRGGRVESRRALDGSGGLARHAPLERRTRRGSLGRDRRAQAARSKPGHR